MCGGAAPDDGPPWINEDLLLHIVLQDVLSEVTKLKVFVDDMTVFMEGGNKELAGIAVKVLKSIKKKKSLRRKG